jgi:hypothetical protein
MDWGCYYGEPIYWDCYDCNGIVVEISSDATAGVGCDIITEDKSGIFKHTFWHFKWGGIVVKVGQVLSSGQLIGYGDSTGYSTGNHLHRQIKKQGRNSMGSYYNINQDNGYQGAEDPMPYFTNIFIGDTLSAMQQTLNNILAAINKIRLAIKK